MKCPQHLSILLEPVPERGVDKLPAHRRANSHSHSHTHLKSIYSCRFMHPTNACLWNVGGSLRTQGEPISILQIEKRLSPGNRTGSQAFIILKFQKPPKRFAAACVEKFEERVRLSDPIQGIKLCSCFHYHLCEWKTATANYPRSPDMNWNRGSRRRGDVLFDNPYIQRCNVLRAPACIPEWAFDVSAGKEDPVWRKDITDLLVEQSQEI